MNKLRNQSIMLPIIV